MRQVTIATRDELVAARRCALSMSSFSVASTPCGCFGASQRYGELCDPPAAFMMMWLSLSGRYCDPERCVHVADHESDIYELFCEAPEANTHFLIRTCVDRLAGDGEHTVADEMDEVRVKGLHRVKVRDRMVMLMRSCLK
jgi:hypothetical protein